MSTRYPLNQVGATDTQRLANPILVSSRALERPVQASLECPLLMMQPLQGGLRFLRHVSHGRLLLQFTEQLACVRGAEQFQHLNRPQ
jgi:hypothetical protein